MSILTKILCFFGILASGFMALVGLVGFIGLLVEGEVMGAMCMLLVITVPSTALTVALSRKLHNSPAPTVSTGLPRYCMKCGQPLAAGMKFCQRCGAPAGSTGSPAAKAAPAKQPAAPKTEPAPYAEYRYTPKGGDRYAQVKCPACGAENKLLRGTADKCQYCGSSLSSAEELITPKQPKLNRKDIMHEETVAVLERLGKSTNEEYDALCASEKMFGSFSPVAISEQTCNNIAAAYTRYSVKMVNITNAVRKQTTAYCDEMITAEEHFWESAESFNKFYSDLRKGLQAQIPDISRVYARLENIYAQTGILKTKLRISLQSAMDAITACNIRLNSCCDLLTGCIRDINDAKFTNTMTRMKLQREKQ